MLWLFNPPEPNAEPTASGVLSQYHSATDFCPAVPPLWQLNVNLVAPDDQTTFVQAGTAIGMEFDRKVIGGTFQLIGKFDYGSFDALTVTAQEIEERINAKHAAELGYTVYGGHDFNTPIRLNPFRVSVAGAFPNFGIVQPDPATRLVVFGVQIGEEYGSPAWSIIDNLERTEEPFLYFPESNGEAVLPRDLQVTDVAAPPEELTAEEYAIYFDNFFKELGSLAIWREVRPAEHVDDNYRFHLAYGIDYGSSLPGIDDPSPWSLLFGPYISRTGFAAPYCAWFAEEAFVSPTQFPGLLPWRFSNKLVTEGSEQLFEEFPDIIDLHPAWW